MHERHGVEVVEGAMPMTMTKVMAMASMDLSLLHHPFVCTSTFFRLRDCIFGVTLENVISGH